MTHMPATLLTMNTVVTRLTISSISYIMYVDRERRKHSSGDTTDIFGVNMWCLIW